MRYLGSKVSTLEHLHKLIAARIPQGSLCDPFGGIGTVGSFFKSKGYAVTCGDILSFAHYFQVARIEADAAPAFRTLRRKLGLRSIQDVVALLSSGRQAGGWLEREYAQRRSFFTHTNARRIEWCRQTIRRWRNRGWLTAREYAILIASLVNSADAVANTAGTYYAYLKTWSRKASQDFRFRLIAPTKGKMSGRVFLRDAFRVATSSKYDVLYLDPPHNARPYELYYHLPESLALGRTPRSTKKSGVPPRARIASPYNEQRKALEAIETLLKNASFRLLVFHYSDSGLVPPKALRAALRQYGSVVRYRLPVKGYSTTPGRRLVLHSVYFVSPHA